VSPSCGGRVWYQKQTYTTVLYMMVVSILDLWSIPETNIADDTAAVAAVGILVAIAAKEKENRKRKRTIWMQPWIANREIHGAYHALLQELYDKSYRNFLRMDKGSFEMLLHKVAPYIRCQNTKMRLSITTEERLAVTLRYLATGEQAYCIINAIILVNR